jgi:AcrR family transcriptional regulator
MDDAGHLMSVPDPTELADGELQRSRTTRLRILEAGIACLVAEGYKGLSTVTVARRAGITRAAMLYHFPSRRELIVAIVHHVTRRRTANFEASIAGLPHDDMFGLRALDAVIDELSSPEFLAYAELALAARTNPELAETMQPAMAAYDDARVAVGHRLFPKGMTSEHDFGLARDVVRFLSEGVALQYAALQGMRDPGPRLTALRHFLRLLISSHEGFRLLERTAAELPDAEPFTPRKLG